MKSLIREFVESIILEQTALANPETSKNVLKKFPKSMKSIGIDPEKIDGLEVLGTGTRGTALSIDTGRVIKVTNDSREALAAASLLGKDVKNLVRYYDVFKLGDSGYYAIVQEKLESASKEEAKELNDALVTTGLPVWIKQADGSWDKAKQLTKKYISDQVKKKFKDKHDSPEAQEYVKRVNESWNSLVKKYGIRDLFETLTSLGIDFHDYHAGNMMKRNDGTIVLIDLGLSRVKNPGKIKTVAERCLS